MAFPIINVVEIICESSPVSALRILIAKAIKEVVLNTAINDRERSFERTPKKISYFRVNVLK